MTLAEKIAMLRRYGTADVSPCQAPIRAVRDVALAIIEELEAENKKLRDAIAACEETP